MDGAKHRGRCGRPEKAAAAAPAPGPSSRSTARGSLSLSPRASIGKAERSRAEKIAASLIRHSAARLSLKSPLQHGPDCAHGAAVPTANLSAGAAGAQVELCFLCSANRIRPLLRGAHSPVARLWAPPLAESAHAAAAPVPGPEVSPGLSSAPSPLSPPIFSLPMAGRRATPGSSSIEGLLSPSPLTSRSPSPHISPTAGALQAPGVPPIALPAAAPAAPAHAALAPCTCSASPSLCALHGVPPAAADGVIGSFMSGSFALIR
eukprot:tig00020830_g14512.t1